MKKSILIALSVLISVFPLHAQHFYAKAGVGYGFALSGQTLDGTGMPYSGKVNVRFDSASTEEEYDIKKVSLLSGLQAKIAVGYMFNQNIGVEVDGLIGVMTNKFTLDYFEEDNNGYVKQQVRTRAHLPAIISPSVVMQMPGKTLTCYARGGIAVPASNKIIQEISVDDKSNPIYTYASDVTLEIKTRLGIGFSGAMGLKYNIGKRLQIWGEASLLSLSLYTLEQTITEYSVNGRNSLSYLTPNQKHKVFEMKHSTGNAAASNVLASYSLPYSNIGICVGVSTRL